MSVSKSELDAARRASLECVNFGLEAYSIFSTGRRTEDSAEYRRIKENVKTLQAEGMQRRDAWQQVKKGDPAARSLIIGNSVQNVTHHSRPEDSPPVKPVIQAWEFAKAESTRLSEEWKASYPTDLRDAILLSTTTGKQVSIGDRVFALAHDAAGYCCSRWLGLDKYAPDLSDCTWPVVSAAGDDDFHARQSNRSKFLNVVGQIGNGGYNVDDMVCRVDEEWAAAVNGLPKSIEVTLGDNEIKVLE